MISSLIGLIPTRIKIGSLLVAVWLLSLGGLRLYDKITAEHVLREALNSRDALWTAEMNRVKAANDARIDAINNLLADSIAEATRLNEQATKEKAELLDEIAKAHLSDSPCLSPDAVRIINKAR